MLFRSRLRDDTAGKYYKGASSWTAVDTWINTNEAESWSYAFSDTDWVNNHKYLLNSKGDDNVTVPAANAEVGGLFLSLGMALGIVVPAILLIVNLKSRAAESPRVGVPLGILAAVLILVGGFVFRYAVVFGGQLS